MFVACNVYTILFHMRYLPITFGSVKFTTCFMFKNLDSKGDSNKKSIDLPF